MTIRLSENIRRYRKQLGLTQEQLAEAMGVSIGAVHKWETGLSTPDITLIVGLANFFDTSVDVLLGYEMKDNGVAAIAERLLRYYNEKNREGLAEAEQALVRYPNNFEIVYDAASLYIAFGFESGEKDLLHRAIELLDISERLLPQNTNPEVNSMAIQGEKAFAFYRLGEVERAVELLRKCNAGGFYDSIIGAFLALSDPDADRMIPYLSRALLTAITAVINITPGYIRYYVKTKQFANAFAFLDWTEGLMAGLRNDDGPDYICKILAESMVLRAYVCVETGDTDAARTLLREAVTSAARFDADPCFDISRIRFAESVGTTSTYDIFGVNLQNGLADLVRTIDNPTLSSLWKEVTEDNIQNE